MIQETSLQNHCTGVSAVCVHLQADFSFYFDTGGRRRAYLAPERFYISGAGAATGTGTDSQQSANGGVPGAVGGDASQPQQQRPVGPLRPEMVGQKRVTSSSLTS